jgi:hypothetical protein
LGSASAIGIAATAGVVTRKAAAARHDAVRKKAIVCAE